MHRKANRSGTLKEAIAVTAELKPTLTRDDILDRSTQVLRDLVQAGTTHVRAHAEFDPEQGFTGFDVVLELRDKLRDVIDIQVVAFPQEGILKLPGMQAMMVEAMEKGADVVGGIPYNDSSAHAHIDYVFSLAQRYGKDIDFHQDFADNAEHMSIEYLARKTIEHGYQGRVCRAPDQPGRRTCAQTARNHRADPRGRHQRNVPARHRPAPWRTQRWSQRAPHPGAGASPA